MKVTSKTERKRQRGLSSLFILSLLVCFSLVSSTSHGKSAAEVHKAYEGLTGKQREHTVPIKEKAALGSFPEFDFPSFRNDRMAILPKI